MRKPMMPRIGSEKMPDYRHRKREQGCGRFKSRAFDPSSPEFRERLRREAELVGGHESTREANAFLGELWEGRLAGLEAGKD
jgi:hypothetical protein